MWHGLDKRPWGLLLMLLFGILSIGCSNEQKTSSSPSLQHVSLQLQWVPQAQFAGYFVAREKGWYREEGIDLAIKPGGADINPTDLVSSGTRDFGTTFLADLALAVEKGQRVVSIGQIQQKSGLLLISRVSSGIKEPSGFVGKRVGIWLGVFEAQFNALLAKCGVPADKVQIVPQGWSMDAFLKGSIDVASAMAYNEYQVVLESGIKPEDLNIIDYGAYGLDFPGDTLFTSRKMTEEKPDLCRRMVRASLKGWLYAIEHPDEAVEIVLKNDTGGIQTREHQLVMMQEIAKLVRVAGQPLGRTDGQTVLKMIETLKQCRILGEKIRPEAIFTNRFLSTAPAK